MFVYALLYIIFIMSATSYDTSIERITDPGIDITLLLLYGFSLLY